MSSNAEKAAVTVQAICRDRWCDPETAKSALAALEEVLDGIYAGAAFTPDVIPGILEIAQQTVRAPAGYQWKVEEDGAGGLLPYLQPVSGIPEGYRLAARVTIGFDSGNFPVKGDLWACTGCGAMICPGDRELHDRRDAEIRSLLKSGNARVEAAPESGSGN